MSTAKRKFSYSNAIKELRKYGFKGSINYPAGKARVKKLWKVYSAYINYTEKPRKIRTGLLSRLVTQKEIKTGKVKLPEKFYNFKFQKLTPKQREKAMASKLFSKHQFTPKGIFIEKPVNIKASKFKISFKGKEVKIEGGNRKDIMVELNPKELIKNPSKAVSDAVKRGHGKRRIKPKTYSITVNGFRSRHVSTSVKTLQHYLKDVLLPDWLTRNEEMNEKDFADIFHLRLIY